LILSNGGTVNLGGGSLTVNDSVSGISSGSLAVSSQYVGQGSVGSFTQAGGTNSNNSSLYLGYNAADSGTYSIASSSKLSVQSSQYIGFSGAGTLTQSGGTNSSQYVYLGYNGGGNGTCNQSGGTNTVGWAMYLAYSPGSNGTYNLSGGSLSSSYGEQVGYAGTGTFTQSGGTNTMNSSLTLGNKSGSSGMYILSGSGVNTINGTATLTLGYSPGSSGTYRMSGTSQLSVSSESVGYDPGATALFQQSGGTNTTTLLSIGAGGQYQFSGGMLQINGGIVNGGSFDGANGSGTISGANCIIDFSTGSWNNMGSTAVVMGTNSLAILPAGFSLGSYTSSGLTHTAGTTLTVLAGQSFSGYGSIGDLVDCQGTITAPSGGCINLKNGLILSGAGRVTLVNGNLTVNDAVSGISGGALTVNVQYVGCGGTGSFTQSGGTNSISGSNLYLGYNAADTGTYNLGGASQLSATAYVGYSGTGYFNQSGTSTFTSALLLGYNSGSNGNYTLNDSGYLGANQIYAGYSGTATFNQNGGYISTGLTNGSLYLGYNSNALGTYNLNGGTLSLSGDFRSEYVGYSGAGNFVQSGGNNYSTVYLGYNAGSNGTYTLSGGSLSATTYVGYSGTGIFNHSGGTNTGGLLLLGCNAGSTATYNLGGTGQLSVTCQLIGYNAGASALFQQSGGTNAANYVVIGPAAEYQLSGGTLTVSNGGLSNQGTFDGGKGPGTLSVGPGCLANLAGGALTNVGAMNVSVGANSLLIVPQGFNPFTGFGAYQCSGMTHIAGSTLTVPAGEGFAGSGYINDPVTCQGTITTAGPNIYIFNAGNPLYPFINLTNGLILSGSGSVSLGSGTLTVNDAGSSVDGGSLSSLQICVGNGGTGTVAQSGGTTSVSPSGSQTYGALYLGYNATDCGTYNLSGTGQLCADKNGQRGFECVGYSGTGNFYQSGGANTVSNSLSLGSYAGSSGTYTLSGTGLLGATYQPFTEVIGGSGSGAFIQSGGSNTSSSSGYEGYLYLGYSAGGSGSYTLTGGQLSFNYEEVGYYGAGTITQSGGTNSISKMVSYITDGVLYLGGAPGTTGAYNLSGTGALSAAIEYVGNSGMGSFNQSGGTNTVGSLTFGSQSGSTGTYNLNGGKLIVASINSGSGTAAFNFGGGTLQASGTLSTYLPMTLTSIGGNANINTAGYAVTLSGQLSGSGGLNKLGTGTLTLSGANTYTGNTTVSAGTLTLPSAGSLVLAVEDAENSRITVASGAKLDLYGMIKLGIGNVTASSESWTLVSNSGMTIYEPSFALTTIDGASFLQANDVWSYTAGSRQWTFTEATGVLSLRTVPEPSMFALLGIGIFSVVGCIWRWRRHRA